MGTVKIHGLASISFQYRFKRLADPNVRIALLTNDRILQPISKRDLLQIPWGHGIISTSGKEHLALIGCDPDLDVFSHVPKVIIDYDDVVDLHAMAQLPIGILCKGESTEYNMLYMKASNTHVGKLLRRGIK